MKIVTIIAGRLYAFRYTGEAQNEYRRLLELWTDAEYVYEFIKANEKDLPDGLSVKKATDQILEDSYDLYDALKAISENHDKPLDEFFSPLHNWEYQIVQLSLRKSRRHNLRIYAIRIDAGCYVITGGAIKLTHMMEEREHTNHELQKLKRAQSFLLDSGIFDEDSFYEFLNQR